MRPFTENTQYIYFKIEFGKSGKINQKQTQKKNSLFCVLQPGIACS